MRLKSILEVSRDKKPSLLNLGHLNFKATPLAFAALTAEVPMQLMDQNWSAHY